MSRQPLNVVEAAALLTAAASLWDAIASASASGGEGALFGATGPGGLPAVLAAFVAGLPWLWIGAYAVLRRCLPGGAGAPGVEGTTVGEGIPNVEDAPGGTPAGLRARGAGQSGGGDEPAPEPRARLRPPWRAALLVLLASLILRWWLGRVAGLAAGSGGRWAGSVLPGGLPAVLPWPVALAAGLVLFQAWRRDGRLRRAAGVLLAATALLAAAGWLLSLLAPAAGGVTGTSGPAHGVVEAAAALYWLALGLFNAVYTARARLQPHRRLGRAAAPWPSHPGSRGSGRQVAAAPAAASPAPGAPSTGAPARATPGKAGASLDPSRVPVVISGFYGGGNAGDEAILASLLGLLRERGYRDLTVFSIRPQETARRHGVKSIYRGWRRDLVAKARALLRARVFISGGGGLLQDTTPTFLFRGPVPYYLLIAIWARLLGCWVLFLGQGVGPLRGRWARLLTRLLANHADVITVRDAESLDVLEDVGVTRPPRRLTADFVFAAQPPDPRRAEALAAREGLDPHARKLVVSVRTWPGRERFYPELAAFLDRVMARLPDVDVVLVPMEGELDRAAAEELATYIARAGAGAPGAGTASGGEEAAGAGASSRVATAFGTGGAFGAVAASGTGRGEPVPSGARRSRVHVLSANYDPADLEALVAGSWLAVGMRLHFLLFAARAGVPVLALNYDPKVAGAMARLGMSRYVFELDRVRAADLLAAFDELVARYDEVSRTLREAAARLAPLAAANLDYVDAAAARTLGSS